MSREANIAAQEHLARNINAGEVSTAVESFAEDAHDHDPAPGGTHDGDFNGVAPTGKKIEVRGLQIGRFEDGVIVERLGSSDELGILKQLGAAPDGVVATTPG